MKAAFGRSGLLSANIGIFSRTEKDGSITYGECGSGVVIRKDGSTCYALTAAPIFRSAAAAARRVRDDLQKRRHKGR